MKLWTRLFALASIACGFVELAIAHPIGVRPVPAAEATIEFDDSGRYELKLRCDVPAWVMHAEPGRLGETLATELGELSDSAVQRWIEEAKAAFDLQFGIEFDQPIRSGPTSLFPSATRVRSYARPQTSEFATSIIVVGSVPEQATRVKFTFPKDIGPVVLRQVRRGRTLRSLELEPGKTGPEWLLEIPHEMRRHTHQAFKPVATTIEPPSASAAAVRGLQDAVDDVFGRGWFALFLAAVLAWVARHQPLGGGILLAFGGAQLFAIVLLVESGLAFPSAWLWFVGVLLFLLASRISSAVRPPWTGIVLAIASGGIQGLSLSRFAAEFVAISLPVPNRIGLWSYIAAWLAFECLIWLSVKVAWQRTKRPAITETAPATALP